MFFSCLFTFVSCLFTLMFFSCYSAVCLCLPAALVTAFVHVEQFVYFAQANGHMQC
jgi:hypothetical protein